MDSYDLGRFPPLRREWNGKYRDTMRDFWRSHPAAPGPSPSCVLRHHDEQSQVTIR